MPDFRPVIDYNDPASKLNQSQINVLATLISVEKITTPRNQIWSWLFKNYVDSDPVKRGNKGFYRIWTNSLPVFERPQIDRTQQHLIKKVFPTVDRYEESIDGLITFRAQVTLQLDVHNKLKFATPQEWQSYMDSNTRALADSFAEISEYIAWKLFGDTTTPLTPYMKGFDDIYKEKDFGAQMKTWEMLNCPESVNDTGDLKDKTSRAAVTCGSTKKGWEPKNNNLDVLLKAMRAKLEKHKVTATDLDLTVAPNLGVIIDSKYLKKAGMVEKVKAELRELTSRNTNKHLIGEDTMKMPRTNYKENFKVIMSTRVADMLRELQLKIPGFKFMGDDWASYMNCGEIIEYSEMSDDYMWVIDKEAPAIIPIGSFSNSMVDTYHNLLDIWVDNDSYMGVWGNYVAFKVEQKT